MEGCEEVVDGEGGSLIYNFSGGTCSYKIQISILLLGS